MATRVAHMLSPLLRTRVPSKSWKRIVLGSSGLLRFHSLDLGRPPWKMNMGAQNRVTTQESDARK